MVGPVLLAVAFGLVACEDAGRRPPAPVSTECVDGYAAGGGWFIDRDHDGYGDPDRGSVEPREGAVQDCGDCDDRDPDVHPGAADGCGGLDDDCDGLVDEVPDVEWYRDVDNDGYGNPAVLVLSCAGPDGYVADGSDCHDGEPDVHPEAVEACNGVDDDCDSLLDDDDPDSGTWYADADWDGYGDPAEIVHACIAPAGHVADATDCDDTDPNLGPWTMLYVDADGDGHGEQGEGWPGCLGEAGGAPSVDDCDDTDARYHEKAQLFVDADGDGYGTGVAVPGCVGWPGYSIVAGDCDDTDAAYSSQTSGYLDADGDGWGAGAASTVCAGRPGTSTLAGDCDDTDPATHPGVIEVCGDGSDNDCDASAGACGMEGDMDAGGADARIQGARLDDHFGDGVEIGADLNADGSPDLVVGAPGADDGSMRFDRGAV